MIPVSEAEAPVRSARVDNAVQAFRDAERVRFLLDKKERDVRLSVLNMTREEMNLYVEMTEAILREYELKREKEVL